MFFSNTHWPQLTAPFYSILFETSICQFNSSNFVFREYLTRDHKYHQRPFLHPESLQILQIHGVRVLSLRSSIIHGFVTEPWYSRHVLFSHERTTFERARAVRSLICVPCFMLEHGGRIPALMSWVSVSCRGNTRAPRSVSLCECAVSNSLGRALFWPRVFCGIARSSCFYRLRAFMLCLACSCPVLHMAGDLFDGHVLVFLFCVTTWLLS